MPSAVPEAMCGVTTTSSRSSRAWPGGSGSGSRDVQPGAEEPARLEGVEQGVVVDQPAAGRIDEHGPGLHRREGSRPEQASRGVGQGDVDRHDVRTGEERLEGVGAVDPGRDRRCREIRVEGRDVHAQAPGDPGDVSRDAAEADEAEHLAVELDALVTDVVTGRGPGAERGLGGADVLGDQQHQRYRVLGGRDRRAIGRVADRDAALRGGGHVHVVVADAVPGDDPQAGGSVHERRVAGDQPDHGGDGGVDPPPGSSSVAGPRIVQAAATVESISGSTGRSNQTRGGVVEVTSPPAAVRLRSEVPAPADAGLDREEAARVGLGRVGSMRPAAADRRDEQGREVVATERRHRRLLDRHRDLPVDRPARCDPQDRPAVDAGDPVAAVLVDAGAVRPAGQRPEIEEDPLVAGLTGIDVVVVRPDDVAVGVGEVHGPPVRREGQAVGRRRCRFSR